MRKILAGLILVSIFGSVQAQDIPVPEPTKAHELFAQDAGTWDCEVGMFFAGPNNPPIKFKGQEVNKLVSNDLYMQTTFTCEMGNRLFEGHSLVGYDPRTKTYTGTWVDSFTAVPSAIKGKYDAKKNTFTVLSTVVDLENDEELKQKQVTTWKDKSNKTFTIYLLMGEGDDQREIKLMEMTAKKRP